MQQTLGKTAFAGSALPVTRPCQPRSARAPRALIRAQAITTKLDTRIGEKVILQVYNTISVELQLEHQIDYIIFQLCHS